MGVSAFTPSTPLSPFISQLLTVGSKQVKGFLPQQLGHGVSCRVQLTRIVHAGESGGHVELRGSAGYLHSARGRQRGDGAGQQAWQADQLLLPNK